MKKILVLCGDDYKAVCTANFCTDIFAEFELRFIEEKILTPRRIFSFSMRRLRKNGLLSLLGTYIFYVLLGFKTVLSLFSARHRLKSKRRYRPLHQSHDLSNDSKVQECIRRFNPDLILVFFCGVLSPVFLKTIDVPIYNIHPGINPQYRGFGNIWAFFEKNFSTVGYTVHKVDEGVDTGERVLLSHLPFNDIPFDEIDGYAAEQALMRFRQYLLNQDATQIPDEFAHIPSKFYGVPTLGIYLKAKRNYLGWQKQKGTSCKPAHILITGASGGLGGALARQYAAPHIQLTLWGRCPERLAALESDCLEKGARVRLISQDARNLAASEEILQNLCAEGSLDLVFLNAGVSAGMLQDGSFEPAADINRVMTVNATCAMVMAGILLEAMKKQGFGRLVFVSSLAALYPVPYSPSYCAAKAALTFFARAQRMALSSSPVKISIVYPGYVDTPMSRRLSGPKPLCWRADRAAQYIAGQLEKGAKNIVFPKLLALGTLCLHLLPEALAGFVIRKFNCSIEPDSESPLKAKKKD